LSVSDHAFRPRQTSKFYSAIRLFNITNDPTESHDLSEERPDIVVWLLGKLQKHQQTALAPFYPPLSNACRPHLFGNLAVWAPYLQQ